MRHRAGLLFCALRFTSRKSCRWKVRSAGTVPKIIESKEFPEMFSASVLQRTLVQLRITVLEMLQHNAKRFNHVLPYSSRNLYRPPGFIASLCISATLAFCIALAMVLFFFSCCVLGISASQNPGGVCCRPYWYRCFP